jgi:hypothetical protein
VRAVAVGVEAQARRVEARGAQGLVHRRPPVRERRRRGHRAEPQRARAPERQRRQRVVGPRTPRRTPAPTPPSRHGGTAGRGRGTAPRRPNRARPPASPRGVCTRSTGAARSRRRAPTGPDPRRPRTGRRRGPPWGSGSSNTLQPVRHTCCRIRRCTSGSVYNHAGGVRACRRSGSMSSRRSTRTPGASYVSAGATTSVRRSAGNRARSASMSASSNPTHPSVQSDDDPPPCSRMSPPSPVSDGGAEPAAAGGADPRGLGGGDHPGREPRGRRPPGRGTTR